MIYDYSYNFGFLSDWMSANPQLSKRKILQALGSNDYECFNRWLNGEIPMPVMLILKFCNTFGIPLENFFRDKNATARFVVPSPGVNDMIEPNGGYPDYGHKHGRQMARPEASERIDSIMPLQQSNSEIMIDGDESVAIATLKLTMMHREDIITEKHKRELSDIMKTMAERETAIRKEVEDECRAERNRLLDIIAQQTTQIAELTKKNIVLDMSQRGFDMASEDADAG